MVLQVCAILLAPFLLAADEHWTVYRSGPFEVLTDAGDRPGREALNYAEQLRRAVGLALGKKDEEMVSLWPVRLVVRKPAKGAIATPPVLARDAWVASWAAGAPPPRQVVRELVRILIESNAGRMPADIERGVVEVYSTLMVQGTRLTLGQPLPPNERTLDWARIHMLCVLPDYSGKLRVLLGNLQLGVDPEAAYGNAFGKGPKQIEMEAQAYFKAGQYGTISLSGRPINPEREFPAKPAAASDVQLALADLVHTPAAYRSLTSVEGLDGLALNGDKAQLKAAADAGSGNARVWCEYGASLKDPAQARAAFQKAAALNPRSGEPHYRLAQLESDSDRKLAELKTAATLDRRNSAYWRALAETQLQHNLYTDATRSWAAAEQAATGDAERAQIRQARHAIEQQRADFAEAEKKRLAEENEREMKRLRDQAMAEVRAAEARVNKGAPPADPNRKLEPWWEGPRPGGKISGVLERVDCISGVARLVVRAGGKLTQLVVRDPAKVVIEGGGEKALGCGVQHPARQVVVEYFPKPDKRLSSAGDVATVEFR